MTSDRNSVRLIENYIAKKLDESGRGIILEVKILIDWIWCRNLRRQKDGWIPDKIIDQNPIT